LAGIQPDTIHDVSDDELLAGVMRRLLTERNKSGDFAQVDDCMVYDPNSWLDIEGSTPITAEERAALLRVEPLLSLRGVDPSPS
jgi:hypothetical protein